MGMPVRVDVRDRVPPGAIDGVLRWLHDVDAVFSTYRRDSAIARLGRGERIAPDPDVDAVLARCEALRRATGGYFDATRGGRLDPSGLVKGWAVDRAGGAARPRRRAPLVRRRRRRRARARPALAGGIRHPGEPRRSPAWSS